MAPIIALIHATPASIAPAHGAVTTRFPDARLWNLLDDRLIVEVTRAGGLTASLRDRMAELINYTVRGGADAVLLTCSMYGPASQASRWPVPVHACDQAMFARIRDLRPGRIAVLGTLATAVADTVTRLNDFLGGAPVRVRGVVVDGAHAAVLSGDAAGLRELTAHAASRAQSDTDLIVLGQYSVSPALAATRTAVSVPVLSPPQLAADALRAAMIPEGPTR